MEAPVPTSGRQAERAMIDRFFLLRMILTLVLARQTIRLRSRIHANRIRRWME